jgi:NADPH:quinone reductase-like Zn-dependent oxidoreductase
MATHFPMPGATMGCDFCGVVMPLTSETDASTLPSGIIGGTRVCGAVFGYNPDDQQNGAFAEYVVADARLLLRVPATWTDLQGAALGGIGWGTAGLALWNQKTLALVGRPSKPTEKRQPVLVYGASTATGTMACQLLALSGYDPIATASVASAPLAKAYGATAVVSYTSSDCTSQIQHFASPIGGIKHALDCITTPESAAICFKSISRVGGKYACLEAFDEAWRTRRAVRVETVLAFEMWGARVFLGDHEKTYSRPASADKHRAAIAWTREMQKLLDTERVMHHPLREVSGKWDGIVQGLAMLQRGEIRGQKVVVRIAN